MKYIGSYSDNQDIATKANVDAVASDVSELETAMASKQATITGAATTITSNNLTASRALVSNSSGKVATSDVTATELSYLDGVTSNIQTQLNKKLESAPVTSVNNKTGAVTLSASDVGALPDTTVIPTVNNATLTIQKNGSTVKTFTANASSDVTANITVPTTVAELSDASSYATTTQLDAKQATITGGATTITSNNLTASRALVSDSSGKVAVSDVTSTELGYLDGATSNIQTQINSYAAHATLVTLTVAGWDATAKTQTVTVSGILADESKQLIIPMPATASMTAYTEAGIQCTGQAANSLTFTATTVPTAALSVYVTYQSVM